MTINAFQSSFNPVTNYLWPDLVEKHADDPYKRVWVANLHPDTTEEDIKSLFSRVGYILFIELIYGANTQKFAIISYHHGSSGITALCTLNDCCIRGRKIHVAMYVDDAPRRPSGRSSTVLLEEFPNDFSTVQIFNHLRVYGVILALSFWKSSLNTRKRARIEFKREGDAQVAILCLNMSILGGQRIYASLWANQTSGGRSLSRRSTRKPSIPEPLPAVETSSTPIRFAQVPVAGMAQKTFDIPLRCRSSPIHHTSCMPSSPIPRMAFTPENMLAPSGVKMDMTSLVLRNVDQSCAPTYGIPGPASASSGRLSY